MHPCMYMWGRILINLCGKNNVRNCDLLQSYFFVKGFIWHVVKLGKRWGPEILIRWPINQSNRFSDFLRLDRLDRFGKIIKSIFSKFWKREFQFFSKIQNFFGFLKFGEKCFFGYIFQISRRYRKCRCSIFVTSTDEDREVLGSKLTIVSRNSHKLEDRYSGFLKFLLRFTRTCTTQ